MYRIRDWFASSYLSEFLNVLSTKTNPHVTFINSSRPLPRRLFFYWSSPPSDKVSVRLLQDGQLLDLDLSDTQMQDILKKSEGPRRPTEMTQPSRSRRPEVLNKTWNDLEDFVVINNKVYAKGDPLPKKKLKVPVLRPTTGRTLRRMDFARFKGEERKFMEERRKEFLERASRLGSMCKARSKLIASKPVNLIWDLGHQPGFVWCPSHQTTSSSSLLKSLRPPRGNEDQAEDMGGGRAWGGARAWAVAGSGRNMGGAAARAVAPRGRRKRPSLFSAYPPPDNQDDLNRAFRSAVRVISVRHPFASLLSLYRDKISKLNLKPNKVRFRELQTRIILWYRPANSTESSPFPTFEEFVKYVVDLTKDLKTADDWEGTDQSLAPLWVQCNVCGSDYNLVLKMETLAEDERFLALLAGYDEFKEEPDPHEEKAKEAVPQEFSQLNYQQLQQLHQRYLLDFQLFGYKVDQEYFDMARST
nr:uncharacterized protein LOC113811432 [Penaeus vannamei]